MGKDRMDAEADAVSIPIKELLKCPICLETAVSPIFNCANGHLTCAFCFERISSCGECKNEELRISNFAERILKRYSIAENCRNQDKGCTDMVKMSDMKMHLERNCEYRDVQCTQTDCKDSIPLAYYGMHYVIQHHGVEIKNGSVAHFNVDLSGYPRQYLPKKILSFGGDCFILNATKRLDSFYWSLSILGGVKEASKYFYETKIISKKSVTLNYQATCSWKLPVLPYHKHSQFKTSNVRSYGSIRLETLAELFANESDKYFGLEICLQIHHQ